MRRALCLQHVPFEGPGVFGASLARRGFALDTRLVPAQGLPAAPGDLLLVMGGPMSVNDPDPWIADEIAFIRRAVTAGLPYLGVCLGSQLLARALGARVGPGAAPEIGMTPIHLTAEGRRDPVFATLPDPALVFEWHGEVFELPAGAVPLAGSATCALQAFRWGERAWGVLFHAELEPAGIEALCRECPGDLARAGLAAPEVLQAALPHLPRLQAFADRLIAHLAGAAPLPAAAPEAARRAARPRP